MDDFISIILKSVKELGVSPVLLLAGFAAGVFSLSNLVVYGGFDEVTQSIAADYTLLLLPLLIMPFIAGGALGYAVEVRKNGSSSLDTFLRAGSQNYFKMLIAAIVAFIVYFIFYFAVIVSLWLAGTGDPLTGSLLFGLTAALMFLCLMAIEFYDVSIVAEGSGVIDAFRKSIDFVRRNLVSATVFFLIVIFLKFLLQVPLMFGQMGAMVTNETYYSAFMNLTNASMNASMNATAANSSALNMTSLLDLGIPPMGTFGLVTVAIFQAIVQGFVFAFLSLYKTEYYLSVKGRKKITDFDYDFSDESPAPRQP